MTRRALVELAFKLAEQNNIQHPFKNGKAGYDWSSGFLKRNKEVLSVRTAQPICIERIFGFTKTAVHHFFDNLETILATNGYRPNQIFNMDESGFSIVVVIIHIENVSLFSINYATASIFFHITVTKSKSHCWPWGKIGFNG